MTRARMLARWRAAAAEVAELGVLLELEVRGFVVVPSWVVERLDEMGGLDREHVAGDRLAMVNGVRIVAGDGGAWEIGDSKIAVDEVKKLRAQGLTQREIMTRLPRLTLTEIYAALAFVPPPVPR